MLGTLGILAFLGPKFVIVSVVSILAFWESLGTILGHQGAHEQTLWEPGLDFYYFWLHFGTPFGVLFGYLGPSQFVRHIHLLGGLFS